MCTPSIALTPSDFAASTASAVSAAVILPSSSVFLVSTSFSFAVRCASVKLLSAAIASFSAFAALAKSNFAFAFCKRSVCALISAWFLRFAIATLFVSSFKISWALAISAW